MVLAASGVDHEELLSVAEPLLSDLPNVSRTQEPESRYVGGDFRQHAGSGVTNFLTEKNFPQRKLLTLFVVYFLGQSTHVALAFELPGGWLNEKDAVTLTVIQVLLSYWTPFF